MNSLVQPDNWRDTLVPSDSTIRQAIDSLEASCLKIVILVESGGDRLVGTLSDGDIRRAVLSGRDLDSKAEDIMTVTPLIASLNDAEAAVSQKMRANKIQQVPICDEAGVVSGIYTWEVFEPVGQRDNSILLMAGGLGTRLLPHTKNCPKPMLEVGGRPILQRIIESAVEEGFSQIYLSVHYLADVIEDYFQDGESFGVRIKYLKEESALGTAGCLSLIEESLSSPLVVANGDVLTEVKFSELLKYHNEHKADATMTVRPHHIKNEFGVVHTSGIEIESFEEKPVYRCQINAGLYVLNPNVFKYLEKNQFCDMPDLFERIRRDGCRTIAYPLHESWVDVGRLEDLKRIRQQYSYATSGIRFEL